MKHIDFAVIGGSYAGLSAALQLARARRQVLVVDAGLRRNRFVDQAGETSHGFLTQDGVAPAQIAAQARQQLMAYPTVQWLDGTAEDARVAPDGRLEFHAAGTAISAARLVLALGVHDSLPPVPGLAERWGRSVFHCPYCHGYEMNAGRIGIIASSALAHHHAVMLPDWGQTTLLLNGAYAPSADELAAFARRGTQVEATPSPAWKAGPTCCCRTAAAWSWMACSPSRAPASPAPWPNSWAAPWKKAPWVPSSRSRKARPPASPTCSPVATRPARPATWPWP